MMKRIVVLLVLFVLAFSVSGQADAFNAEHATAFMEITFTCGCSQFGTGAMIGRRGLITAAHNLYCKTHAQGLKSCNFAFGSKSLNSAWYRYSGGFSYRAYDNFEDGGYYPINDIGYVIFDKPVGDDTGYFGWLVGSDETLDNEYVNVYGYTNKGKPDSLFTREEVMYEREVSLNGYLRDTGGGPIVMSDGEGRNVYVVGVYTWHDSYGYGRRLTMNVINDMRADGAFN